MIRRGEVWWVDLGPPPGSAPARHRPVVIVSGDRYNRSRLATVIAVALTTNLDLRAMPGNVAIDPSDSGLGEESVANVTQIVTVDRDEVHRRVGALPAWVMAEIDAGLLRALDLRSAA